MAVSRTRANIKPAGISSVGVMETGGTNLLPMNFIRNGKAFERVLFVKDGKQRQIPYAIELEASWEWLDVSHDTNCIDLLDDLANINCDWQIDLLSGVTYDTKLATDDFSGLEISVNSPNDRDEVFFVGIKLMRRFLISEMDTVRGTQTIDSGNTGTFAGFASLVRADIKPAGINKIELDATGNSFAAADSLELIRNAKFKATTLGAPDSFGRPQPYGWKFELEADLMQNSSTEVSLLDTINGRVNDVRVTFANGLTATFVDLLGIEAHSQSENDLDDISVIHIKAEGHTDLTTNWGGIWS